MFTQRVRDVQKIFDTIDDLRRELTEANAATRTSQSITVYREYQAGHADGRTSPLQSLEELHPVDVHEDSRVVSQSRYRDGQ